MECSSNTLGMLRTKFSQKTPLPSHKNPSSFLFLLFTLQVKQVTCWHSFQWPRKTTIRVKPAHWAMTYWLRSQRPYAPSSTAAQAASSGIDTQKKAQSSNASCCFTTNHLYAFTNTWCCVPISYTVGVLWSSFRTSHRTFATWHFLLRSREHRGGTA